MPSRSAAWRSPQVCWPLLIALAPLVLADVVIIGREVTIG